jgi:hypothetical protein
VDLNRYRRPEDWRLLLKALFKLDDYVWISWDCSGRQGRMLSVAEWLAQPFAPGKFIDPRIFRSGSIARSAKNVIDRPFLLLCCAVLNRFTFLGAIDWLKDYTPLRAVVAARGRRIPDCEHQAWFVMPSSATMSLVQPMLLRLGFTTHALRANRMCRLPGIMANGSFQSLKFLSAPCNLLPCQQPSPPSPMENSACRIKGVHISTSCHPDQAYNNHHAMGRFVE